MSIDSNMTPAQFAALGTKQIAALSAADFAAIQQTLAGKGQVAWAGESAGMKIL